ncbi:hypothetical protein RFI_21178 [Reticulomyxa filosa]|uniref:Uncharacterized protein n=1 Tax=Reticulomyxa filosa TaxID=46433 RepID=X6MQA0_RETFI|nr:hypothetical protein RFI_21178 [Reticulomyxa filosa]|eukprot:ETO16178.1 hypothetical protein RFI_21178 [Reticulomyxa filosa]
MCDLNTPWFPLFMDLLFECGHYFPQELFQFLKSDDAEKINLERIWEVFDKIDSLFEKRTQLRLKQQLKDDGNQQFTANLSFQIVEVSFLRSDLPFFSLSLFCMYVCVHMYMHVRARAQTREKKIAIQ